MPVAAFGRNLSLTRPEQRFGSPCGGLDMLSSWKSLLLVIAHVAALAGVPALAQPMEPTLRGVVRDAAKSPIAGASVVATNQATGKSEDTATAADGSYSFMLPPGSYSLKAWAPGFSGPTLPVDIVPGRDSQLDFTLTARLVEVVRVTATKREAAPIDVPFSVAARTEQDLRDRGTDNIEALAANVGSFTVQNLGPGQSQVAMRGVSAGQIARDQPGVKEQVGIYLDESPVSLSLFTPDLDLVDVNRVEVLRGPQGTLFGAGSVTGTVRYITNQPALQVNEGFVEAGGAIVEEGGGAGDLKAGINVPMGGKAAGRFVGYRTLLSGYTEAVQPDLSTDRNVNDGFRTGARATITILPNDRLTVTPRLVYQRVEANGWNLQDAYNILANPFTTSRPAVAMGEREEFTQLGEEFIDDFLLADLSIRYDFGPVAFTSVTSYIDRDINIVRDTTALTASFTGGNMGFPEEIYALDSPLFDDTSLKMWTQELRLMTTQNRVQFLGGVFYSHAVRDYGQNVTVPGFEDKTGIPTEGELAPRDSIYFSDLGYDLDQVGLFGEATFSATDRLTLTAGLRWYHYAEDKTAFIDGVFGNPNNGMDPLSLPGSADASGLAPRMIAAYRLSDEAVINVQVSRGFRLGGVNDPLNEPLCSPDDLATFGGHDTWEDESVWNYEVGLKSRLLGGKASLNLSAFHIDIHDLQTTVTAGTCSSRLIFNVPRARSRGMELEFEAALGRHFDFAISGSYNDAELRSALTSTDSVGNVSIVSGIEKGRRLPSVPELQAAAFARYQFELSAGVQMYLTGNYQHVGSRFTQVGDEDLGRLDMTTLPNTIGGPLTQGIFRYNPELPAYDLLNLRVGLRRARWDLSAYVHNATNELAYLSLDRERGTLARIGYLTNQPRTFGISTRYSF
jgi:iron complex outermembrane recepter protein